MGQEQRISDLTQKNEAKHRIEKEFPGLRKNRYKITSDQTSYYNCIAWAAGDTTRWWWPIEGYWPKEAPRLVTIDAFIAAYGTIGFVPCNNAMLEAGFEKIVIYADSDGVPTHAARQLSNNKWTSKLGGWEDIEHTLMGLEGKTYGKITTFLKRPLTWTAPGLAAPSETPSVASAGGK